MPMCMHRLDDLLAGVSATIGAAAATPGSSAEGGTGSAKVPQVPKQLVQVRHMGLQMLQRSCFCMS